MAVQAVVRARSLVLLSFLTTLGLCGCRDTVRRTGQVELFAIDAPTTAASGSSIHSALRNPNRTIEARPTVDPKFGDAIRYPEDVVTISVPSVYIDHLPASFGSGTRVRGDVILFAEVWENSAEGFNTPSLNTIVFVAEDQVVPGRLNFTQNLAYGPTCFKGYPLKVKFTLMILDRKKASDAADQVTTAASTVSNFMSAVSATAPYAGMVTQSVSVVRDILKQLPNVVAFDFEATLFSDAPQEHRDTILGGSGGDTTSPAEAFSKVAASRELANKDPDPNARAAVGLADITTAIFNPDHLDAAQKSTRAETISNSPAAKFEKLSTPEGMKAIASLREELKKDPSASPAEVADKVRSANQGKEEYTLAADHLTQFSTDFANAQKWAQTNGSKVGPIFSDVANSKSAGEAWSKVTAKAQGTPPKTSPDGQTNPPSGPSDRTPIVARTTGFEQLVAWFDYGYYALIETESRSQGSDGSSAGTSNSGARSLFPLGFINDYEYAGGWIQMRDRSISPVEEAVWERIDAQYHAASDALKSAFKVEQDDQDNMRTKAAELHAAELALAKSQYGVADAPATPASADTTVTLAGDLGQGRKKEPETKAQDKTLSDDSPGATATRARVSFEKAQTQLDQDSGVRRMLQRRVRELHDSLDQFNNHLQRSGTAVPDDRLQSNYVIFSIMPGQLEVDRSTLAAASRANEDYLRKLQGTAASADDIAKTLKDAADATSEILIRQQLESQAVKAARVAEQSTYTTAARLESAFDVDFDKRVAAFASKPSTSSQKNGNDPAKPNPPSPPPAPPPAPAPATPPTDPAKPPATTPGATPPDQAMAEKIQSIAASIKTRWHGRLESIAAAKLKTTGPADSKKP